MLAYIGLLYIHNKTNNNINSYKIFLTLIIQYYNKQEIITRKSEERSVENRDYV